LGPWGALVAKTAVGCLNKKNRSADADSGRACVRQRLRIFMKTKFSEDVKY
jgi:hypothetical protein